MHGESTDSNTDASIAMNTNTATDTKADTNETDALADLAVSNRDASSLPGELLSKHTLRFRNTGREKSVRITEGDTR